VEVTLDFINIAGLGGTNRENFNRHLEIEPGVLALFDGWLHMLKDTRNSNDCQKPESFCRNSDEVPEPH
jgi:hypothetical protein